MPSGRPLPLFNLKYKSTSSEVIKVARNFQNESVYDSDSVLGGPILHVMCIVLFFQRKLMKGKTMKKKKWKRALLSLLTQVSA